LRRVGALPAWRIVLAVVVAMLGRLIAHVLSGVVFFASYAEGKNVWLYSLGYNGTYMVPEMVVTSILSCRWPLSSAAPEDRERRRGKSKSETDGPRAVVDRPGPLSLQYYVNLCDLDLFAQPGPPSYYDRTRTGRGAVMATKYIFVTGGVVSGIGKGSPLPFSAACSRPGGIRVLNQKFDPISTSTRDLMSPTQHGEVSSRRRRRDRPGYRPLRTVHRHQPDCTSDITTGMIYRDILQRERDGAYNGTTVQVVPT
jgi:hypothetical protein